MFLTLKVPITTIVAFAASVDQDQAAQNVQPDLESTLSALGKLTKQKQQWKCDYFGHICTIKMCDTRLFCTLWVKTLYYKIPTFINAERGKDLKALWEKENMLAGN